MSLKRCFVLSVVLLLLGIGYAHAQVDATLRVEKALVVARGKWSPVDQKPADGQKPGERRLRLQADRTHLPLVEVHCFRVVDFCVQAAANVQGSEPQLAVEYYEIRQWDSHALVAENKESGCRTRQIKVSFSDGNVTFLDSPKKSGKGEACGAPRDVMSYELIGEGHAGAGERIPAQ